MSEYIPGAPNAGLHIPKRYVSDESVIDKNFHHASLVGEDDELASIEQIHELMPYIYCSSWDIATDMSMLRGKNIKFVLNLSPARKDRLTLESMAKAGIEHAHYPVENVPDWRPQETATTTRYIATENNTVVAADAAVQIIDITRALPMACGFIKRAQAAKRNILVHDDQGTSAAPAAIAYFLLRSFYDRQIPETNKLQLILNKIKIKRPCVDINFGFIERLEDFESTWSGRAVIPAQSLSIRRNPVLKARETAKIRETVAVERQQADADWKKQIKIDGSGVRRKLL